MFPIVSKRSFSEDLFALEIEVAPVAQEALPGHYVDVHINPDAGPITLPIALADREHNTITVVERAHDLPSEQLMMVGQGDELFQVRGPLGTPCAAVQSSKALLAADGLGVASLLWRARMYREAGAHTICVVGYPTHDAVYWQAEFTDAANEMYVVTEDGSYGVSGSIAAPVRAVCETHKNVDQIVAISSLRMMKRIAKLASNSGIPALMNFDAERESLATLFNGSALSPKAFAFARAPEVPSDTIEFDKLLARLRAAGRKTPDTPAT